MYGQTEQARRADQSFKFQQPPIDIAIESSTTPLLFSYQ
jgi:hypothetical protein